MQASRRLSRKLFFFPRDLQFRSSAGGPRGGGTKYRSRRVHTTGDREAPCLQSNTQGKAQKSDPEVSRTGKVLPEPLSLRRKQMHHVRSNPSVHTRSPKALYSNSVRPAPQTKVEQVGLDVPRGLDLAAQGLLWRHCRCDELSRVQQGLAEGVDRGHGRFCGANRGGFGWIRSLLTLSRWTICDRWRGARPRGDGTCFVILDKMHRRVFVVRVSGRRPQRRVLGSRPRRERVSEQSRRGLRARRPVRICCMCRVSVQGIIPHWFRRAGCHPCRLWLWRVRTTPLAEARAGQQRAVAR